MALALARPDHGESLLMREQGQHCKFFDGGLFKNIVNKKNVNEKE